MPAPFVRHFGGPKFGVAGTRKLAGVEGRPLIGTIIKPSVGLSPQQTAGIVKTLAEAGIDFVKDDALVIHGHRNGFGMLNRHPQLGIEFPAYQKLWRLAGVDHLHVNGIKNKFWEDDDSVVRSIHSCLRPLHDSATLMPVISSGQWGGQACETYRRTQTTDLLYLAGGGIKAHPDGPTAGLRSLQKWWEAAVEGLTQDQAAAKYPELQKSAERFGER